MPGVAYTTGTELDPDHKEIHCSLGYVERIPPARAAAEVAGVLLHELVHCFQHSGRGTCPGGLVEGVADWVRLRCGLAPPHWSPGAGCSWDAGYQSTAYFLDFLDRRHGGNLVRRLNGKLRLAKYDEATFWTQLTGSSVDQLWRNYKASLGAEQPDCRDEKSSNDTDKVGSTPKMSASSSHVPYEDGGLYMSLPSPIDPVE
ncbi:hypothetical protein HIM_01347 [Hirsutella minnesotensis 3608]|nr:hypothetical protein HIM_01347 [Hirsutella minnesotensis 3608]